MKIAILGAGNTGKAYSVYLSHLGHEVALYDRSPDRLTPIVGRGITATARIEGLFPVSTSANLTDTVRGSRLILICTVAGGHRPLASALRGLLEEGQHILITNGCWGAVEFDSCLGEEASEKGCTISETGGQLILCNSPSPESVYIKTIKKQVPFSCTKPADNSILLNFFATLFPQLCPAPSVLYTSLNNSNPVSHGPFVLFNLTRMENGEDYLLFGTGMTERVARFIERIDRERVEVVRACGTEAATLLDMLNASWPDKQSSLYDVFHNTPAYSVTKGPATLNHRFLTEDLPYGLVPYLCLGKRFGIETPALTALVQMIGLYMETDYLTQGPELEALDLSRFL